MPGNFYWPIPIAVCQGCRRARRDCCAATSRVRTSTRSARCDWERMRPMEWWSIGVVEYWSGVVLEWWSIGVVEYWSGGVLEWWSIGVVEYWSGGVLEWWSIGVVKYWSDGVL